MMRPAAFVTLTTALLASSLPTLPVQAAEALNNKAMDSAYIPEAARCLPGKDKSCPQQTPTRSLTDKALRDAEQQNTQQQLNNPNLNNPDALPPPLQLPPPELSPQQQQLIEQIRHLPSQL